MSYIPILFQFSWVCCFSFFARRFIPLIVRSNLWATCLWEMTCATAWLFTSSTVTAGLTTLVEWIISATCVSPRLCYYVMLYSKLMLWGSLVVLFSLVFYLYCRSTLQGGGRQSALLMLCVLPIRCVFVMFGVESPQVHYKYIAAFLQ